MTAAPALDTTIPAWAVETIIRVGKRLDARGWVPATAGNFSVRLPDRNLIAITASGWHKGFLTPEAVMLVDPEGAPVATDLRPSAETGLHCQIYRLFPQANVVLHGHSVAATVLSMEKRNENTIILAGYELLKIFGFSTHNIKITVPIIDNSQDICHISRAFEATLAQAPADPPVFPGYIIRGHGVYVWGKSEAETLARLEGLEFLLACELERKS